MVNKINNSNTNINNIKIVVPTPKPKRIYTRRQSSAKSGSEDLETAETRLSKLVNRSMPSGSQPNISIGGPTILTPQPQPQPYYNPIYQAQEEPFALRQEQPNLMNLAEDEVQPVAVAQLAADEIGSPDKKRLENDFRTTMKLIGKGDGPPIRAYSSSYDKPNIYRPAARNPLHFETDFESDYEIPVSVRASGKPRGRPVGSKNRPKPIEPSQSIYSSQTPPRSYATAAPTPYATMAPTSYATMPPTLSAMASPQRKTQSSLSHLIQNSRETPGTPSQKQKEIKLPQPITKRSSSVSAVSHLVGQSNLRTLGDERMAGRPPKAAPPQKEILFGWKKEF